MAIEQWSDQVAIAHLAADPQFSDDIQSLLDPARRIGGDVVLDFSAIRFVNSSHIARLLKLRKRMIADGNQLVLCGIDSQVWTAFLVTGLDKVFQCSDSVPTALATLQMAREPAGE